MFLGAKRAALGSAPLADFAAAAAEGAYVVGSTGNQDLTDAALGARRPKAALVWSRRSALNHKTESADFNMSFGATDGTTQAAVMTGSVDNTTSAAGTFSRNGRTDKSLITGSAGTGSVAGSAVFDAWVDNGITLNVDDTETTAFKFMTGLLAGSDLTVSMGTVTPATGGGQAVNLGFRPDAVILFSVNDAMSGTASTSFHQICIGFVAWDKAGNRSEAFATTVEDTGNTRRYRSGMGTDACHVQGTATADTFDYQVSLTRDVAGFTAVSTASAGTDKIGYLALKIDGGQARVGTWDFPTSTGDHSKTGVGCKPACVILCGTDLTAANYTQGSMFGFAFMAEDIASMVASRVSDNAASGGGNPTDQRTVTDMSGLFGMLPEGGTDFDMEFVSMTSDGWAVNVVDAPAAAYRWPYLALSREPS